MAPLPPIDAAAARAATQVCQRVAPDVHFAAHFMPSQPRHALFVVLAVAAQLRDIVVPPIAGTGTAGDAAAGCSTAGGACETPAGSGCPSSGGVCASGAGPGAGATKNCLTGSSPQGCVTCGGDSPEQRRAVCSAVLDFLYNGEKTGKPELDAFLPVAQAANLDRDLFERCAEGMTTLVTLKRYATWKRLRETANDAAGSLGVAMLHLLRGEGVPHTETLEQQATAWASSMALTRVLAALGHHVSRGVYPLPLDDLIRFGISERELERFTAAGRAEGEAWQTLLRFQIDRLRLMFDGGAGCLRALDPGPRRAMAVLGQFHLSLLERMEAGTLDPFARADQEPGLLSRLAQLPKAVGLASRLSVER